MLGFKGDCGWLNLVLKGIPLMGGAGTCHELIGTSDKNELLTQQRDFYELVLSSRGYPSRL